MRNRITVLAMAVLLTITMFPCAVFADSGSVELPIKSLSGKVAASDLSPGYLYKLGGNTTITIASGDHVIIDRIEANNETLTIQGSVDGQLTVTSGIHSNGSVIINGGNIYINGNDYDGGTDWGAPGKNGGKGEAISAKEITISGGIVVALHEATWDGWDPGVAIYAASMNVTGGDVSIANHWNGSDGSGEGIYACALEVEGKLTVSGGKLSSQSGNAAIRSEEVEVSGTAMVSAYSYCGYGSCPINANKITVSGEGSLRAIADDWCDPGMIVNELVVLEDGQVISSTDSYGFLEIGESLTLGSGVTVRAEGSGEAASIVDNKRIEVSVDDNVVISKKEVISYMTVWSSEDSFNHGRTIVTNGSEAKETHEHYPDIYYSSKYVDQSVLCALCVSVRNAIKVDESISNKYQPMGLYKVNGEWICSEHGQKKNVTGMVRRLDNRKWYFVKDGVYDKSATGLVQCVQPGTSYGKWYYVQNGDYYLATGLVQCIQPGSSYGKWYYVDCGKQSKATGLVQCVQPGSSYGKWYYVNKGKLNKQATGMVKCVQLGSSKGKWYYVEGGKQKKATGVVQCIQPGDSSKGKWYYIKNGKHVKFTGKAKRLTDGKEVYVENGKVK